MIRKVVVPAAGLGTRLLPATKEQPKEMLPVFALGANGQGCLKPLLQLVFEQLYDLGFREFCFIIGRGKRAIEDHFTQDYGYVEILRSKGKSSSAVDLERFYARLDGSTIVWVTQPEPRGFGDAVLKAEPYVKGEKFLVQAGDTYIISRDNDHLKRLMKTQEKLSADAAFIVQEVDDPRQYGVVEAEEVAEDVFKVKEAVEKPEKPASNLAIMPIYIFDPAIFKALEKTPPGKGGEVQLTDAIQALINMGLKVYAVQLKPEEVRLDIGNPEMYWKALQASYNRMTCKT
jgi:UTP--glucose-1-phosphate uridylyltransferase